MTNFTEEQLIPYAIKIIKNQSDGIDTANLIIKLREVMQPNGEDIEILSNRSDDKFSQKVRNLKSHKTLEKKNLVIFKNNKFYINQEGLNFNKNNEVNLEIQKLLSIPILTEWPLSIRTHNVLKSENIIFLGDLYLVNRKSLLKIKNFGKKSSQELDEMLLKYKISDEELSNNLLIWESNRNKLMKDSKKYLTETNNNIQSLTGLKKGIFIDINKLKDDYKQIQKIIIAPTTKPEELEKIIIHDIEYILSLLKEKIVDFFRGRYGYEENYKTLEQLGAKYGITRERVRQLEKYLNLSLLKLGKVDKKSLVNYFKKYEYVSFHKLFPLLDKKFTDTARGTGEISGDKLTAFLENYCGLDERYFKTPERELWNFNIKKLERIFKITPNALDKEIFLEIIQQNYGYNKFVANSALEFLQKKNYIKVIENKIHIIKIDKQDEVCQILINYPEGLHWKKILKIGNKSLSNNHWSSTRSVADHSMTMEHNPDIYLSDRGTIKLFKFCKEIKNKNEIIDFFINYLKSHQKNSCSMEFAFKELIGIEKFKNLNFYDARAIIKKFGSEKGIFHSGRSGSNTISLDKKIKTISLKEKIKEVISNFDGEIHIKEIENKLKKSNEKLALDIHLNDLVSEMVIFRISPGIFLNFNEAINLCDKDEVNIFLDSILNKYEFITSGFMREQINENLGYNLSNLYYATLSKILAKENNWYYGQNYLSKKNEKEISAEQYIKKNYDDDLSSNENFEILSKKIGISKMYFNNIMYQSKSNFNTDWVYQSD